MRLATRRWGTMVMLPQWRAVEPSIEALREAPIHFRYGKSRILVDAFTANAMLVVYRALTQPESRAKFERLLTTSPDTLGKLADFCFNRVQSKH